MGFDWLVVGVEVMKPEMPSGERSDDEGARGIEFLEGRDEGASSSAARLRGLNIDFDGGCLLEAAATVGGNRLFD